MLPKHLMVGAAAIRLLATPALAESQNATPPQQQQLAQAAQQELAQEDLEFATEAAKGGLKEVQLGELAQQQAESEEVQQFGQRMVEDHGMANEQLMQIAEQKGIELPTELAEDALQLYEELQQKSGQEFDQAYMDEMVSDHEEDVQLFQQYAESGQDPDLTAFAEETLPVLEQHLQLAQQTQKQISAALEQGEQPDAAMQGQQQAAAQPQQSVSIEEVLGSSVVNAKGAEVGQIEDIVVDQNQRHYAVLSVGGFLGIGDKRVAVPLDQMQLGENEAYLMSAETEAQLEQMPTYEEGQYQPFQRQG